MAGLPLAGKDTYIQENFSHLPVISLDDIREEMGVRPSEPSGPVAAVARERAKGFLRTQTPFVWNATNTSKQMRSQLIDLFLTYGVKVKILYIEKPYAVWRKQNREREFMVPEAVLDTMLGELEVPQLGKAHEVVYSV